ncbi:retroviral-like aspartic protease family protein [Bacillus sp. NP157]|nr:retroviral-like aspartic protease family protein [Bacillus sp. NP157]
MLTKIRAGALCLAVALACACSKEGGETTVATSAPLPTTAPELMQRYIDCARKADLPCAEAAVQAYVKLRPTDDKGLGTLAFVLNQEGKDKEAIAVYQQVLADGVGTYDVFAGYADSLAKVGRTDEAIDWSYKTLKLVPSLVDVRGNLAKLLVRQHRRHEALALLTEFDQHLDALGHDAYFTGQRVAIESLPDDGAATQGELVQLRLVKLDNTYYAPVQAGKGPTEAFVVDTGATTTAVDDIFLADSKVPYRVTRGQVTIRLADGHSTVAREVVIEHLHVGAFDLENVKALACRDCALLLGVNVLSQFNINSTEVQGVDTMTLSRREPGASQANKAP